jgi:hypoxanthine phosphoribosyltransferase
MNCTELSLKKLREVSIDAVEKIAQERSIDLIVYVATAGYPIASFMNEVFKCQMVGIGAQRKGNKLKQMAGPIVAHLPKFVRNLMISFELKSNVHKKSTERNVEFHSAINNIDTDSVSSVLIVDDSVDTGNSMKLVYNTVKDTFANADVCTYSLNVWEQSKEVFQTDYCTYTNTIIKTPMSKDSKEYKLFRDMYDEHIAECV